MGRHDDERYDSEDKDTQSKRKRKHYKSSRKHDDNDRKSRKRNREDSKKQRLQSPSSEESSISSHSRHKDRQSRKKDKKHKKRAERREKKQSKKARPLDEKRRPKDKDDRNDDFERLDRNYSFANALQSLLEIQPGMASELPILLIRLADGTSFVLDQMPDARVSARLQLVLASLSQFGVERDETGSWSWSSGGPDTKKDPLLLLKIARSLLDEIGISIEAVGEFEKKQDAIREEAIRQEGEAQKALDIMSEQTNTLLQQFQKKQDSAKPSLAQELATLCDMILKGESISLDGIPDEHLRDSMENLFRAAGLEKSEMDNDSDSDEEDDVDEPVMGYGLSDADESRATANLMSILEACKTSVAETAPKRVIKGPMMPPQGYELDKDEEDEEGPAPIGSENAMKRVQKGPSLPPDVVKAMAEKRARELAELTGADIAPADGEREQWMLEPGEHDLLQGIKTGKNVIKSRTFENKKKKPGVMEPAAPMDPKVQAEVDAIMEMQRQARGPSLMEQHRLKRAEEKAAEAEKGGKAAWKWDRNKNLDDGRRVDKNALNMVMGGAAANLKDKFHGGLGR